MEVRACKSCGKLFNYMSGAAPFCPNCMKALEEKFQQCKEYIRDNPGANIQQVSDENEVSVKMIKQWVREERLVFAEGSGVGIECEACGKSILTGRFCEKCKNETFNSIKNAGKRPVKPELNTKPKRDSAKMRFLEK